MSFRLPATDEFLTEGETAAMLTFSVAKLRVYRRGRRIGCTAIGRHILHSGKHIRDFLASCNQNAPDAHPTVSTGSASDQDQTYGSEPGSIPEAVRLGAQALAVATFSAPTKRSSYGGRKTAA